MENDVRALLQKYREAVQHDTKLRVAKELAPYTPSLEEQLVRAEAKVQAAEVTILATVRTAGRR